MKKSNHPNPLRKPLNTLGQNGTGESPKSAVIISGEGSDLSNMETMKRRAKRKMITNKMILSLVDIATKKEDLEKKQSYWNTYHCQNKIFTSNGRLYGKYCKNRFCTLCCSIRKAYLINKYYPVVSKWQEPYFVTLTAKSVPLKSLNKRMKDMNRGFRKISAKYKKRAQRGKGVRLLGIKSLESNFNPITKKYNPHLHLIVATKEMADILIKEWLTICTREFASPRAQKARKVEDLEHDLIEIIKYGSKIFTEPDVNNKAKNKGDSYIHTAALDNIFTAMKGIRIFERFGFNLPKEDKTQTNTTRLITDYKEWEFDLNQCDWINVKTGEPFSGFVPKTELKNLLDYHIDMQLE